MANVATWINIGLGAIMALQWFRQRSALHRLGTKRQSIEGLNDSLLNLNHMCNDASVKQDAKKPAAMARFIADVAQMGRVMEGQVHRILADGPQRPKQKWHRRIIEFLFPAMRL